MRKLTMILMLMLMASLSMAQGFTSSGGGGGGATQADIDAAIGDIIFNYGWSIPFSNAPSPAYLGNFYAFSTVDTDFNPSENYGDLTIGKAAHFMIVCAAGGTDTQITVSGTSVTDAQVVTPGDSELLKLTDGTEGAYYETSKKWLGIVAIEKTAGTDRLVNYGWCKYWDNRNGDFEVLGGEATWMGDKLATMDLILYHHKAEGWTYSSTNTPTPPDPLFRMSDSRGAWLGTLSNVDDSFKVVLSEGIIVEGSASEGVIMAFEFTVGGCIEYGQVTMDYKKHNGN